jgi:hypothetical protein
MTHRTTCKTHSFLTVPVVQALSSTFYVIARKALIRDAVKTQLLLDSQNTCDCHQVSKYLLYGVNWSLQKCLHWYES